MTYRGQVCIYNLIEDKKLTKSKFFKKWAKDFSINLPRKTW